MIIYSMTHEEIFDYGKFYDILFIEAFVNLCFLTKMCIKSAPYLHQKVLIGHKI